MARRAVECFRKQTYQNKRLHVLHTGIEPVLAFGGHDEVFEKWIPIPDAGEFSIGKLRNYANQSAIHINADILIHFDDDDWSHPNRIEEQVALLKASGKQAVGYRTVLFCDERNGQAWRYHNDDPRYCIGSSLAYLRSTWERKLFKDINRGEDREFLRDIETLGVDSIVGAEPRMVCSIHDSNTASYSGLEISSNWQKVPLWDSRLREIMDHA